MRRLFSTFAAGPPGAGLLVLRAAAGAALVVHMSDAFDFHAPVQSVMALASGAIGACLVLGVWTPIAGVLAAIDAAWISSSLSSDRLFWLLLGADAFALALLGPGKWSIDARVFGWKRLDFGDEPARSPD